MNYAVVILSKNPHNLQECTYSIYQNERDFHRASLIVVDDGAREKAEANMPGTTWVDGVKPFCFSRNANIGLRKAFETHEYAILLNDDALLQTRRGFTSLIEKAQQHTEIGLLSPACNNVGNPRQQHRGFTRIRLEPETLCFICVVIPRSVYEHVGPIDEDFKDGYGWEDTSYCQAVKQAGYRLGIYDPVFADHSKLKSTYRGDEYPTEGFRKNQKIYQDKWATQ